MPVMRHTFTRILSRLFGALGQYNLAAFVLADEEGCILQLDVNGNLKVAPGAPALWGLYNEDAPATSGDLGQAILAVRNDGANTVLTSANLDYSWIAVDDRGQVFVRTDPSPAEAWQTLRTFAATVADAVTPAAIQVVVGIVDVSLLAYPGAGLPGLTITINGFACTFGAGAPTDMANLLALLTAANPDVVWTAPGPAFVLIGTKATPGNIVIGGDAAALAIVGLAAGTTGPWVALPQSRGLVEVGFLPGFSVTNAPHEVILRIWRLSADTGGIAEIAGEMHISADEINRQESRRFSFDGSSVAASMMFVGFNPAAPPTLTGTLDVRVVYDGDQPVESPTWHAVSPGALALDGWDNSPTQPVYNYGTSRGDGAAAWTSNTTLTLTPTTGIAMPTTGQLRRVRVVINTTLKPLDWEQDRNAVLTIAGGVITVNALDGTVITIPAGALSYDVFWEAPDKSVIQEDSAHASLEYLTKIGVVRRDVPVSSGNADGDWVTINQDADGYVYVRVKGYDSATDSVRVSEIAPIWSRNVQTPTTIASAQNATAAWVDLGAAVEIGTQGYKVIALWLNIDINDSTNLRLRALFKHTAADTDEYSTVIKSVDISGTPYNEKFQPSYQEYDVDGVDTKVVLPFDVENYCPYVQFQVMAEVAGATPAQIVTAKVTYGY